MKEEPKEAGDPETDEAKMKEMFMKEMAAAKVSAINKGQDGAGKVSAEGEAELKDGA